MTGFDSGFTAAKVSNIAEHLTNIHPAEKSFQARLTFRPPALVHSQGEDVMGRLDVQNVTAKVFLSFIRLQYQLCHQVIM